jgi:hypothetical protein
MASDSENEEIGKLLATATHENWSQVLARIKEISPRKEMSHCYQSRANSSCSNGKEYRVKTTSSDGGVWYGDWNCNKYSSYGDC